MKAAVYEKYGPPEVVKVKDIPIPIPKKDEVLIKVIASAVNRTDCGFRSAEYFISRFFSGLFRPKSQVLGCEFAGIIEESSNQLQRLIQHSIFAAYISGNIGKNSCIIDSKGCSHSPLSHMT